MEQLPANLPQSVKEYRWQQVRLNQVVNDFNQAVMAGATTEMDEAKQQLAEIVANIAVLHNHIIQLTIDAK